MTICNLKKSTLALFFCFFFFSCSSSNILDTRDAIVMVNGRAAETRVGWQMTAGGALVDIAQFMEAVGGRFTPVYMNSGIVAQYGKRIGFATNNYEYGMVETQLCKMEPRSKEESGRLWAPLGFIEALLNGDVFLDGSSKIITVTAPAPQQIGDIEPEAKKVALALENRDYTVLQGGISLINAVEVCAAGYSPNANANNGGFPYLCIQPPLTPDAAHSILAPQFIYTQREDEGLIVIGRTPPACDYYSYRSYFLNRCVSDNNPVNRKKVYAQLGDPINAYNIMEPVFYPVNSRSIVDPFESFFILVSTADRQLYEDVLAAVSSAGLDPNKVLLDIVDHNLINLGNDDFADMLNFLHRFSVPHDPEAGQRYIDRPTMEILRLTPTKPRQANYLEPFAPRQRGSGITEDSLKPAVAQLRQAIIDEYSADYHIRELDTHIWMAKSGGEAIAAMEDVLGETRDTLYLKSDNFNFNKNDIIIVYGVNHTAVSKSVYSNVSCYGAKFFNGSGGIRNHDYQNNVVANFPSLAGAADMDKLYVWKFARTPIDADTFVVPPDTNNNLNGINFGDEAFMGFRAYIDPDSPNLIGPDPNEIIRDRAVVLTPKN
jgi:hypothetical protein